VGVAAAEWLAKQDPLLVGSDNWPVEVSPNPDKDLSLPVHQIFLVVNGIHILENLKLDELVAKRVHEFAFTMQPLKIYGASASSFRSLHESIVNYGGNRKPEFLTCMHEESSVAMAHGYAKAAGKPMGVLAHGSVGLQHAAMAVYNAWCDRVPVMLFGGNFMDAAHRRPGVEWYHCVQDPAGMLRDFVKWDDQPASLQHFAESVMR